MSKPQQQSCQIRLATKVDVDDVLAIECSSYPFPWKKNNFLDCFHTNYEFWLLVCDQEIIGYGVLNVAAGEAHIMNICIKPPCQRGGLGLYLLNYLSGRAEMSGVDKLILEVRESNVFAYQLYVKMGFLEVGRRQNYYPAGDKREAAIVLIKEFGNNNG